MVSTNSHLIPAGRTARLKRGDSEVQVQTEYAPRPTPRITSSILISGELLHKIETPLESAIETQEQLEKVERQMLRQHSEALKALKNQPEAERSRFSFETMKVRLKERESHKPDNHRSRSSMTLRPKETAQLVEMVHKAEQAGPLQSNSLSQSDRIHKIKRTTLERLYEIEGVDKIATLDWKGRFLSEKAEKDFKRKFSSVYKHLNEAIEIFAPLSNGRGREEGVFEAENRRLYMVSHCGFIYFLIMKRMPRDGTIEDVVRSALKS
jgi:hypothetical protein